LTKWLWREIEAGQEANIGPKEKPKKKQKRMGNRPEKQNSNAQNDEKKHSKGCI